MNRRFQILTVFAAIALFVTAFGVIAVQAQPVEKVVPAAAAYENILGKSLDDTDVANFIASNHCANTSGFQLCNTIGMALWIGQNQKVETVYLYPNAIADFSAYKGTLPLGLSPTDTMASVEYKFGQPRVVYAPFAGWMPGLPDESGTPDHTHYWAMYKRFGVTIVYNTPSAMDKGATIYAILVSK